MAGKPLAPQERPAKPKRPTILPHGRWLGDFEPLSEVERQLVEHCARGELLSLGNEEPEKPGTGNIIRADIIRFLLLGGDDQSPVHEKGVMVEGVWIKEALNLLHAHCPVRLVALTCRFEEGIIAVEAKIPSLQVIRSSVPSVLADGVRVEGDLVLGGNFTAAGEVRMLSAEIGGDLDCRGGTFCNEHGDALGFDGIRVRGNVFLSDKFSATGPVRILGAEIGGDLDCKGGTFSDEKGNALCADRVKVRGSVFLSDNFAATGKVRMPGAEIGSVLSCIGGTFSNEDGQALLADRIKVKGGVYLRENFTATGEVRMPGAEIGGDVDCMGGTFSNGEGHALTLSGVSVRNSLVLCDCTLDGVVNLEAAFAGTLIDDQLSYRNATLILDGFRYDRVSGQTSADARIGWLKSQQQAHLGDDFRPQPWEHLVRVLRDMGHPAEAAQIAMAKQEALREARQIGRRAPKPGLFGWRLKVDKGWGAFSSFLSRRFHWFYGVVAGYGHRPMRIVWSMLVVCALCSLAYYGGRDRGLIGPSAPLLQMHPTLARCGTSGDAAAAYWTSSGCPMPPEYSTFQPFVYSLDVIIPFVDLHQESEWGPVVTNARGATLWWGRALRWLLWLEIIFGWIASVMFVAIVGRLVDKD